MARAPLPAERLGVEDDLRQHALAALWKWRDYAANPFFDPDTAEACRVTARTCEWIVADLSVLIAGRLTGAAGWGPAA